MSRAPRAQVKFLTWEQKTTLVVAHYRYENNKTIVLKDLETRGFHIRNSIDTVLLHDIVVLKYRHSYVDPVENVLLQI